MTVELLAALLVLNIPAMGETVTQRGPTLYDRVLAVNMFGTKAVMLLAIIGFIGSREGFIDIAILYALINFIATVALLRFVESKRLGG